MVKRRSVRDVLDDPRVDQLYVLVTRYYPIELRKRALTLEDSPFDVWDRDLAPSPPLLGDYKKGLIDWDTYKQRYLMEVSPALIKEKAAMYKVQADGKEVVFVCEEEDWEYPRCHTWIILEVLEGNPDSIQPEIIPSAKAQCIRKLREGILPEKIILRYTDRVIEISFHPASGVVFTRVDTIDWKGELSHFSSKWDSLARKTLEMVIEQVESADKIECKFPEEKHWLFKDLPSKKKELPLRGTLEPWVEAARTKPLTEFTEEEIEEAPVLKCTKCGSTDIMEVEYRPIGEAGPIEKRYMCRVCHDEVKRKLEEGAEKP